MSRLLVVEPDGHLSVRRPDAPQERSSLGAPESGETLAATCWTGDGLAVVSSYTVPDRGAARLVVHELDAGRQTVHDDVFPAFYLSASPDGARLAHLADGPLGLELGVLDLATGRSVLVERGQPLFCSWAPDGSALVTHVADEVALVDLSAPEPVRTVVSAEAGEFTAPWWRPDGGLIYAVGDELVARGAGGEVSVLVEGLSPLRFVCDADRRRIAYADPDDDGRVGLSVFDTLTESTTRVLDELTAGFFWDPEGRRLAAVVAGGGGEPSSLRWAVWDGAGVERFAPFVPGPAWVGRALPFFEQYAQSHAVWSPDGGALVAVGRTGGGPAEVLVQRVDGSAAEPQTLGAAELAWFAPV